MRRHIRWEPSLSVDNAVAHNQDNHEGTVGELRLITLRYSWLYTSADKTSPQNRPATTSNAPSACPGGTTRKRTRSQPCAVSLARVPASV
jgi:hypothetical protein